MIIDDLPPSSLAFDREGETLGEFLDRKLVCGSREFEWGQIWDRSGRAPMAERPCGQPLKPGQRWEVWRECGTQHARCPQCGWVTLFAIGAPDQPDRA